MATTPLNLGRLEKVSEILGVAPGVPLYVNVDPKDVARVERVRAMRPPAATPEERTRQAARRREGDERDEKRRAG